MDKNDVYNTLILQDLLKDKIIGSIDRFILLRIIKEVREKIESEKETEFLGKVSKFKDRLDTPTLQRFKRVILNTFNDVFELEEE